MRMKLPFVKNNFGPSFGPETSPGVHMMEVSPIPYLKKSKYSLERCEDKAHLAGAIAPCLNRPVVIKRNLSIGHR